MNNIFLKIKNFQSFIFIVNFPGTLMFIIPNIQLFEILLIVLNSIYIIIGLYFKFLYRVIITFGAN